MRRSSLSPLSLITCVIAIDPPPTGLGGGSSHARLDKDQVSSHLEFQRFSLCKSVILLMMEGIGVETVLKAGGM